MSARQSKPSKETVMVYAKKILDGGIFVSANRCPFINAFPITGESSKSCLKNDIYLLVSNLYTNQDSRPANLRAPGLNWAGLS